MDRTCPFLLGKSSILDQFLQLRERTWGYPPNGSGLIIIDPPENTIKSGDWGILPQPNHGFHGHFHGHFPRSPASRLGTAWSTSSRSPLSSSEAIAKASPAWHTWAGETTVTRWPDVENDRRCGKIMGRSRGKSSTNGWCSTSMLVHSRSYTMKHGDSSRFHKEKWELPPTRMMVL